MELDDFIKRMEKELSNIDSYSWHNIKQNDELDRKTNFIYKVYSYKELLSNIKQNNIFSIEEIDYAKTRWYNFHTAKIAELIFETFFNVEKNKNEKDRKVDFSINGLNFDHKNSVFPKKYPNTISFAKKNKKDLILWLYNNQSQHQRYHLGNRLFIIFYNSDGVNHWKVKSNFQLMKKAINNYMKNYSEQNLIKIELNNRIIYSDIIFIEK